MIGRRHAPALLLFAVLVAGCGDASGEGDEAAGADPPPPTSADSEIDSSTDTQAAEPQTDTTEAAVEQPAQQTAATWPVVENPERIEIPAIEVDASVIDLGLTDQGGLEVPTDWDVTGWWTGGAKPGQVGPTVIAGHVDSTSGPAVFFRLEELAVGDEIIIEGADGTRMNYAVERMEQFAKAEFPTRDIYGPTGQPTLRLITCGGPFDDSWGHYTDNVVVYATAADL